MASKIPISVGKKIKKIRQQKGLTQEQLAIASKVSYTSLTKIENEAIKNPSFEAVASIAVALGISLDDLINDTHE